MPIESDWKNKVLWLIVGAIIASGVYFGFSLIQTAIQARDPKLTYYLNNGAIFAGTGKYYAIYDVYVSNVGKAKVDNVAGAITTTGLTISDIQFSSSVEIPYTSQTQGDKLEFQIAELNPKEMMKVSVFSVGDSIPPGKPIVSLRGSGVTAIESTSFPGGAQNTVLPNVLAAVASTSIGFVAFINMYKRNSTMMIFGKHADNQNTIMAYLCGVHGLIRDVENYVRNSSGCLYWVEADRFASIVENDATSGDIDKIKGVLLDLPKYANMNQASSGIVEFDLARIEFAQGHQDKAKEHLANAKKQAKAIVNHRLKFHGGLAALSG